MPFLKKKNEIKECKKLRPFMSCFLLLCRKLKHYGSICFNFRKMSRQQIISPNSLKNSLLPIKNSYVTMHGMICTCQTFLYYANWLKTNFEVIFKIHFRSETISKIVLGPYIDLQNPPYIFWKCLHPWGNLFVSW